MLTRGGLLAAGVRAGMEGSVVMQRRAVILAAVVAVGAGAPAAAGLLPDALNVIFLCAAACAAAIVAAAVLRLDGLFAGPGVPEPAAVIDEMVRCAEAAAKDGVGALAAVGLGRHSPGLRRGVQLIVAGQDAETIRSTMERELDHELERRARGRGGWEPLLAGAPIAGAVLCGAVVIGLVASGGTPAGLGTGVTLGGFGGVLACLIALTLRPATPAQLAQREAADVLARMIVIRGVTLIASGSSPRQVGQELATLLPPRPAHERHGAARRAA